MENGESIKLWVAVAAIILLAAVAVLAIDFKTKREILDGINIAHDDLEKLGIVGAIAKSERGANYPVAPARFVDPGIGSIPMANAAPVEEGIAANGSGQKYSGVDGDHAEFPKRNRRARHPGISETGKRVGSRTVAKVPKEDDTPKG